MDSSTDNSFEEIEESMLELVQRAEGFLQTYSSTSGSSSSSSTSSSGSSLSTSASSSSSDHNNSTHSDDDYLTTVGDSSLSSNLSSHESSLAENGSLQESSVGNASNLSVISEISSSTANSSRHFVNLSADLLGDDSGSTASSSFQRTFSDDCILVSRTPVQVIDLCSPRFQRSYIRRIANSAPIVDIITLDDTINETLQQQQQVPEQPQAAAVVNEYHRDGPPAKRSKEGPRAVLNLSQISDGEEHQPAIALSCPICYDSIFKRQAASTICGHLFCNACINQEIQLRKQCPLCKRKLARNHIHPIYSN